MQIDPRHLMQLAAIVDAGGFSEAAARLATTQPALSRTVAMLEKRLGETLFLRRRRPLQPTPLCSALVEQGQIVLAATRKATENIDQFHQGERGLIRIAGTPFFMDAVIAGLVADFQSHHPRVTIEQSYGYTGDLLALIRSGKIDLAFSPVDVLDVEDDVTFVELLQARNVVACRAGHPLIGKPRVRTADLLSFPWIAPPPTSPLNADLRSALVSMGAERIRVSYSGGSLGSVVNHMKASDCLTVLPHSVVFAMRMAGEISALPIKLDHPRRVIGLLRSNQMANTPTVERFASHMRRRFDEMKDLIRRHEQIVVWGGGRW